MKYLLDSQTFLWVLYYPHLLGTETLAALEEGDAELWVSLASIWELGLKNVKKEKLQPYTITQLLSGIEKLQANLMEIKRRHIEIYEQVKLPHKDPFDTLLVAQSKSENCVFLTADNQIISSRLAFVSNARK